MPHYFTSMLADVDRADAYRRALKGCIADWRHEHAGDPVILDLGVGTGLLTLLALTIDAGVRVIAVDTNRSVIDLARESIKKHDPRLLDRVDFAQTGEHAVPKVAVGAIDIIVSEILGTFTTSELAHTYVSLYMKQALRSPENPYIIPRCTKQFISVHEFPTMPQSMQWALRRATERAASVGLYCPTGDGGLGILLDAYASQKKMFREMRVEYYGVNPMQSRSSSEVFVLAQEDTSNTSGIVDLNGSQYVPTTGSKAKMFETRHRDARLENGALTVLEWSIELWKDVWLHNTLDGYRTLRQKGDSISPLVRNSAWGVFVAPYTTDLSSNFSAKEGNFKITYNVPFSTEPTGSFELFGPYITPEASSHGKSDDASAAVNIEWVRHVADASMVRRLAKRSVRELRTNPRYRRIVVWDDLACGETAVAIKSLIDDPTIRIECVYSSSTESFEVAKLVGDYHRIPTSVAIRRKSRSGTPFQPDASTLVIAPRRVLGYADDLDKYTELTIVPSRPIESTSHRVRVSFPPALTSSGLGVVGTVAIYKMGYSVSNPVRMSPFLAFGAEEEHKGIALEINEAIHCDLPVINLANIRRIANQRDWKSLYARIVSARSLSFRGITDSHDNLEKRCVICGSVLVNLRGRTVEYAIKCAASDCGRWCCHVCAGFSTAKELLHPSGQWFCRM